VHLEIISLIELNLEQVSLACTSYNNGFWVYDPIRAELIRIDQNLKPTVNSGNLMNVVGDEVAPVTLVEYNKWVYLYDPKIGMIMFDVFGSYYKTIPILNIDKFQIVDEDINYLKNDTLFNYSSLNLESVKINLPVKEIKSFRLEGNKMFLLKKNRLEIYSIN